MPYKNIRVITKRNMIILLSGEALTNITYTYTFIIPNDNKKLDSQNNKNICNPIH